MLLILVLLVSNMPDSKAKVFSIILQTRCPQATNPLSLVILKSVLFSPYTKGKLP